MVLGIYDVNVYLVFYPVCVSSPLLDCHQMPLSRCSMISLVYAACDVVTVCSLLNKTMKVLFTLYVSRLDHCWDKCLI